MQVTHLRLEEERKDDLIIKLLFGFIGKWQTTYKITTTTKKKEREREKIEMMIEQNSH